MPPPRRGKCKGKGKGKFGKDKKDQGQRALFRRRKFCRFTAEKIEWIDYKDIEVLKDFINENGKIIPARITGTKARYQRQLSDGDQARALPRAAALHRPALRRPTMQVILMEKVVNLGNLGDVVKVKDGFARNFLIPHGKAKRATEHNLKEFEARRAELEKARPQTLAEAQERGAKLDGLTVQITQKAGLDGRLFGSVTNSDIVEALKAQGLEVERRDPHAAGPAQAGRRVPDRDRAAHRRGRDHQGVGAGRAVATRNEGRKALVAQRSSHGLFHKWPGAQGDCAHGPYQLFAARFSRVNSPPHAALPSTETRRPMMPVENRTGGARRRTRTADPQLAAQGAAALDRGRAVGARRAAARQPGLRPRRRPDRRGRFLPRRPSPHLAPHRQADRGRPGRPTWSRSPSRSRRSEDKDKTGGAAYLGALAQNTPERAQHPALRRAGARARDAAAPGAGRHRDRRERAQSGRAARSASCSTRPSRRSSQIAESGARARPGLASRSSRCWRACSSASTTSTTATTRPTSPACRPASSTSTR